MAIQAAIILTSDTPDMGGLRALLAQATRLGIPPVMELVSGGQLRIEGEPALTDTYGTTLGDLADWLGEHEGLADEVEVKYAGELAVPTPDGIVEEVICGEHRGKVLNLTVTFNPACWDHGQSRARVDDLGVTLVGGQRLVNVHPEGTCRGPACCIHNPTEHPMRSWPQNFRPDRGRMERMCSHGVGHPDPDDLVTYRDHGCDGCCAGS